MSATYTIYTWPYQWVYWPAYRALKAATESGHGGFKWTICSTDDEVKGRCMASEEPALAISEPPHGEDITHRPILWRLPHWHLAHVREDVPGQPLRSFAALPAGSTSGDFARRIEPSVDPEDWIALEEPLTSGRAITFNPWHEWDRSRRFEVKEEYYGPTNHVIASIWWPTRFESEPHFARMERVLSRELRLAIERLYRAADHGMDVTRILEEEVLSVERPEWLRGAMQLEAIILYLKRMAYFPYLHVDQAIGDSLEAHVRRALEPIPREARTRMLRAHGYLESWGSLSVRMRARIQDAETEFHGKPTGKLVDVLLHVAKFEDQAGGIDWPRFLENLLVEPNDRLRVPLLEFRDPTGGVDACQTLCEKTADWGWCGQSEGCFVCDVLGRPHCIANSMARSIDLDLSRREPESTYTVRAISDGRDSVVALGDVRGLWEVFCGEFRGACDSYSQEDCSCIVQVSPTRADTVVAIGWTGCTRSRSGTGDAERALRDWADSHPSRDFLHVWMSGRFGCACEGESVEQKNVLVYGSMSESDLSEIDLAVNDACFRYLAVFTLGGSR